MDRELNIIYSHEDVFEDRLEAIEWCHDTEHNLCVQFD